MRSENISVDPISWLKAGLPERLAELEDHISPAPLLPLIHPLLEQKGINVLLKRTDLIHPVISGNKWYKLKFNLAQALQNNADGVLSFGGAWSNHIHALAKACRLLDLPLTAVIRGEPELLSHSRMLQDAVSWGMQCHFVSRVEYRKRGEPDWLNTLSEQYKGYYLVPEGGSSDLALPGVMALGREIEQDCRQGGLKPDQLWCAMGTGGTVAGLLAARTMPYRVTGVPVLKGGSFLYDDVVEKLEPAIRNGLVPEHCSAALQLLTDGHGGGYGRVKPELISWLSQFELETGVQLDPVYTGKLFYRFFQAVDRGECSSGDTVILLHSGGLQGRRGYGLEWIL
ncbi:1-aminocyclopropane-1-carboxylate deaminase/D-cysteine desulfhydrase [Oceanospirillum sediminis]|uniref:Pyridoxal-phosphate dependent enzyme n=1 Tax=Oceanospirillum sediminis TaxID=2760088 RepID=A0A839IKZ9_9GAMM|nr:pyridoxal-phosphate dependent enzyme [Oceanospirillum sediminis]MBB1485380.1 pyridoxal-phosphate dependent enzyme [Oceanospirillum sediminis]